MLLGGLVVAWLWAQRSIRSTQLQNTANALQASETRLRMTMDAVRDGLWSYNHITRNGQWDDQIRHMLGYGDDYLSPSIQTLIKLIHPADLSRLKHENAQIY